MDENNPEIKFHWDRVITNISVYQGNEEWVERITAEDLYQLFKKRFMEEVVAEEEIIKGRAHKAYKRTPLVNKNE